MKNIIVPTDFSQNAKNALAYALAIAKKTDAKVVLFHSYHLPPNTSTTFKDISPILKKGAEQDLTRLCKSVKDDTQNSTVVCETIARKGHLVNEIKTVAKEKNVDLIVMGTKGASGISEIFIGTNTASVIEGTTCPVMAIPECATFKGISRILYATDYNAVDVDSIHKLAEIAEAFGASILLLHVASDTHTTVNEDNLLESFAQKVKQTVTYPHISYQLIESRDILNGLNSIIKNMNIDLVALTTRRRTMYEKFFNNSITKKMAYHTTIPLLAFHA
jgi:nucleotide-binding universal stress UspA family protein